MKQLIPWDVRNPLATVRNGESIGSCCGSKTLKGGIIRKWKNQYGEGITGDIIDPVKQNTRGILVIEGQSGKEITEGKTIVKHIETKNGVLTVSVRKEW